MISVIRNKKFLFILAVVLVALVIELSSLGKPEPPPPNVKTPPISALQKSIIGKTTADEVERLPRLQKKEVVPNGNTKYEFAAFVPQRPNEIITKDGISVFERIDVPQNPQAEGYVKLAQFIMQYGQPEKVIQGSAFFGPFVSTYIYSHQGFSFIGNPHTDEVYEIQVFTPITVASYIEMYGDDIKEGPPPEEPLY